MLEHAYGASFLAALLLRRPVPGLGDEMVPTEVRFQQAAHSPVDDLVVVGRCGSATRALFVGVRRNPTVGASDTKFVSLVTDFLRMLTEHPVEFDDDRWRVCLAVASPLGGAQQVRELARLARRQRSNLEFRAAIAAPGAVSGKLRQRLRFLDAVVAQAANRGGIEPVDELTWRLLRALRILQMRLEGDDPIDRAHLVADLTRLTGDAAPAADLWRQLLTLSAGYAQAAATVDHALLRRDLAPQLSFAEGPTVATRLLPPVPGRFVNRAHLVEDAAARLVDGPDSVVALIGMGGAGKSTIARATVADARVRMAFPDGVQWLDLGPAPDLTSCLARVAAALGDTRPIIDQASGRERIRELLAGRRHLLVLDNLWEFDHLRCFPVDGTARLLVTTRSRDALYTDTGIVAVGLADPATARSILASYAGTVADALPPEADEVLRLCGGLVLALALVGGMVAEGFGWEPMTLRLRDADLARLAARFADYPYSNLLAALEASIQSLPEDERRRFIELVVFEGRGQLPLAVVHELWHATGGTDASTAEDLLTKLAHRSLVQIDRDTRALRVHDLLIEFARTAVGEDTLPGLHQVLARALFERWGNLDPDRALHRAADDPVDRYTRTALVGHLLAAGDHAGVARLLGAQWSTSSGHAANAWYEIQERAGTAGDYLADVRAWWRYAAGRTDAEPDQAAAWFAIEARCALIIGSVVSRAAKIPHELLRRLIADGLWSAHQAATHVSTIPDRKDRAEALGLVASLVPADALPEVVTAARAIDDPLHRAAALTNVLPHLPVEAREYLADAALDGLAAARYIAEEVMTKVAPHLPPALLDKALGIARGRGHPSSKAAYLIGLAPHCAPDVRGQVAAEAVEFAGPVDLGYTYNADVVARALPFLDEESRAAAREDLLRAVRVMPRWDSKWRDVVPRLLPVLPEDLRPYLLAGLLELAVHLSSSDQAKAYEVLAPHLNPGLARHAMERAGSLNTLVDDERLMTVVRFAARLPAPSRSHVLAQAVNAVRDLDGYDHKKVNVLAVLAPVLPENLIPDAVAIGRSLPRVEDRAQALAEVAPHTPEGLRHSVVADVLAMADDVDEFYRGRMLDRVAAAVPSELVHEAVPLAEGLKDMHGRARILSLLAASATGQDRRELIERTLAAVRTDYTAKRCECIETIAASLPADLVPAALDVLRPIDTEEEFDLDAFDKARTSAIAALAKSIPREHVRALLDVARIIDTPADRAYALTAVARGIPPGERQAILGLAVAAALQVCYPGPRAQALTDLLALLSEDSRADLVDEAVRAAEAADVIDADGAALTNDGHLSRWARLVPYLHGSDRAKALARARTALFTHGGSWLARMVELLESDTASRVRTEPAQDTAPRNGQQRSDGLLPSYLLATFMQSNDSASFTKLDDNDFATVAKWIPEPLLGHATTVALAFKSGARATALTSLLPRLTGQPRERLKKEALAAARTTEAVAYRALALAKLVPNFGGEARAALLQEAIATARQAITTEGWRTGGLIAAVRVLPYLPDEQRPTLHARMLDAIRALTDVETRIDCLTYLAPSLPEPVRREVRAAAVELARTVTVPYYRRQAARRLADSVCREQPPDYLTTRAALELVSGLSRPAVVETLKIALADTDVMPAVGAALEDVQRWWS